MFFFAADKLVSALGMILDKIVLTQLLIGIRQNQFAEYLYKSRKVSDFGRTMQLGKAVCNWTTGLD